MTPFPYQERDISNIFEKIKNCEKLLFSAQTGYGKTFCFSYIANEFIKKGGAVVVLCHKEELMRQTHSTLSNLGVRSQMVTSDTKSIHALVDCYVCMIETIANRLGKNKFKFPDISLVIIDEAHIMVFQKVFKYFDKAKFLGFTATPVVMKKVRFFKCKYCKTEYEDLTECCGNEAEEWSKPFTMSSIYDDIVVGEPVSGLIDFGQLVPEVSFVRSYSDLSNLKIDSKTGDYTVQSLDEAYSSDNSVFNCYLNYKELCDGKRTLVFNSSTKTNRILYEKFKAEGVNVRMYDSVNTPNDNRKELVEWFENNDDAVLMSVSTFTTGFDNKEVQAIILNRSTLSLSLFLQICGRGGRSSTKIYKESFILVDGGDNIAKFGEWSSDRDWEDIFWNGIGKPKAKKEDPLDVQDCDNCGALIPKSATECEVCGCKIEPPPPREKKEVQEGDDVLIPIKKIPPPNAKRIYEYTVSKGENFHFALNVLYSRIIDMFVYYRVTRDLYESTKANGKLEERLRKMIYPVYFHLIKQPDIQTGANRTLDYVVQKAKEKVEKYYYK